MKPKGRPSRKRLVRGKPKVIQFSPRGRPGRPEEVVLNLDEYEAMRLVDLEGLDQNQAAGYMCTSRPTAGRLVRKARYKIAQALSQGMVIKINKP